MNLTILFTFFTSIIFVLSSPYNEEVSKRSPLSGPSLSRQVNGLVKDTTLSGSDINDNFDFSLKKVKTRELNRFDLIYRRQSSSSTPSVPDQMKSVVQADKPVEKSGIGNTIKKVEKKWVKIIEIVIPIAVGIPVLIIIGITCFLCCSCCRLTRQKT